MAPPQRLSIATLSVFLAFVLVLASAPGALAFLTAPTTTSTTFSVPRWINSPASSRVVEVTAVQRSSGSMRRKGPRRARAGVEARMSSPSPSETPSVDIAAAVDKQGENAKIVDPYVTDLPDSFEDSIVRMGRSTFQSMEAGQKLLRVDFDTSAGDPTYTTLKASLEMAKQLTKLLAEGLIYGAEERTGGTLALFFPDAGSAALAKFEWGAGTESAQVPEGVRFCTVKTEEPIESDVGCILLCPRNSEADFALELVKKVKEKGQFMVLVNPELINMGTTGYGLAGRRIRDEIISEFQTCYYLRTLSWGAVTKEQGKRYTVWQDDTNEPTGYRLLKAVSELPVGEALDDIYNIANGLADEDSTPDFLNSIAKFVRDFGRL